jgi:hypothetical protein
MNKKNRFIAIMVAVILMAWTISWNSMVQGQRLQTVTDGLLPVQDVADEWVSLFDGKTLDGWRILQYGGDGMPHVRNGSIVLPRSETGTMTGVCWVGGSLPVMNYEIFYEARRVVGSDIFAALTFPYGDTYATLIFGGWSGIVNGLSSIDGYDASENETCQYFSYNNNQWYPVQLRVTPDSIRSTVGREKVVDLATTGKDIHLRTDILDTGLTLWTYVSTGEIRNLRIKKLH